MYRGDRQDASVLGVFVGRQREMDELKAALDEALAGQGRLVMLVGEPGIGKTRLAQELASHATVLGFQVLWGWCYEAEGAPPYWPWVQPIRSYFQQRDPEQLRAELGPGAADIAEVIPELGEKLPGLKPPPALEPEQARFRLFDSINTFLKNAARSQPLMLVLDDLHWADKSSLLLLQFLARQLGGSRLLVVGCYRDVELSRQHPLSEALAQLAREPVFQRKLLRGLSQEDTGHFIEVTAGTEPPPRLVETVYAHTEGNPFFTREVVRLLSEQGELTSEMGSPQGIRIPEGVREVIGQRLNRLSEQCNQTLATASVIGREFDFKLLHAVCRGDSRIAPTDDQLLQVVDEALNAHVIEELPGSVERYQFAHALIQQTLSEELSTSRRVRLHARIGEALEELYGADAETHAAELAHHFAEAQTILGTEKLVRYSLLAGERALAAYGWEEALAHFQRALAAKEGLPIDTETAALLFGLGRAQAGTLPRHQLREVATTLRRAVDYYVRSKDVARAVAVAEFPVTGLMGHRTDMAQLVACVLPLVPPGSHAAGRVLCNYGFYLGLDEADYQGAQEAFSQALAIAQGKGDRALEARVLVNACEVDFYHLQLQEAVRKSQRAIELARSAGEPFAEARGHRWACQAMIQTGDLEGARKHASALLSLAEQLHDRELLVGGALFDNEETHRLVGDWATARDFHRRLMEASPQDIRHLCRMALLEYQTGNLAEGQQCVERILEVMPLTVPGPNTGYAIPATTLPAISRISGVMDHLELAESAARIILASPPVTPVIESRARVGLGLVGVLRQDRAAAQEQYPALEPWRGTLVSPGLFSMDRLLGLLAHTLGNLDKAVEHFEDALAFCRKAGYRPELAWTCCDYADCLLLNPVGAARSLPLSPSKGGRPGHPHRGAPTDPADRAKAMPLLDEALAISRELGMRPLLERAVLLQEQAESQPRRGERPFAPTYPDGLTEREVEVLRLIAVGKTDRAIAEELIISVRTVTTHVSNILNKTGAANRTEAATYASRHGLV